MNSITAKNFSLKHTLECGQFFRHEPLTCSYFIAAGDKIIKLRQEGSRLFYSSNSEKVNSKFIRKFFRLDEDYEKIIREISKDVHVKKAVKRFRGLRLIRQEPFECLISYMCSAASSIPRIKKNINELAKCAGKKAVFDGFEAYAFPEPKQLCRKDVSKCGLGFRAGRIYEAMNSLSREYLEKIRNMKYPEAKKELMKISGVGEKIADCVLLFSMDFPEAFPVDTWVRKTMIKKYFRKKVSDKKIREKAKEKFGKYAGYAQQFLFHSARNHD